MEGNEAAFILSTNTIRCHVNDMVFFSERGEYRNMIDKASMREVGVRSAV